MLKHWWWAVALAAAAAVWLSLRKTRTAIPAGTIYGPPLPAGYNPDPVSALIDRITGHAPATATGDPTHPFGFIDQRGAVQPSGPGCVITAYDPGTGAVQERCT